MNTTTPVTRRVRAYFAPVDRTTSTPMLFYATQSGRFALDAPPAPWIDLGWCTNFKRNNAESKTGASPLTAGAPAVAIAQARTTLDATVDVDFASWGKLQLALSCGTVQLNLLDSAAAPVTLLDGSTATALHVGNAASPIHQGDLVVVDIDYTGQLGYIGSGVSGAYIRSATEINSDVHYIRRISLNVARIASIANGILQLESPLLAGAPSEGMKICRVLGFADREGSSFFQEWSALFVMDGEHGDRILFHYPRLQAIHGATESAETLVAPLERVRLSGSFRALAVRDALDGETVLCHRSYLPA